MAGSGVVIGNWWGEPTPDVAAADVHALVYDSAPVVEPVRMQGTPLATLAVSVEPGEVSAGDPARLTADWFVRLEDVWPDGRVSLVTGGGINGAQRFSRSDPQAVVAGEEMLLPVPQRYSTYTFVPGHRIRMVVTNAQFPMVWPSAQRMTTTLRVGGASTMHLPTVAAGQAVAMPEPVLESPRAPDAEVLASQPLTPFTVLSDDPVGITEVEEREASTVRVGGATYDYQNVIRRWVDNRDPAHAGLVGRGREVITRPGRTLTARAVVHVASDERSFHVTVRRSIAEDGVVVRTRTWQETVPRDFE